MKNRNEKNTFENSKIIQALLEEKFKGIDSGKLLEIIGVTPDARVATELLCGIYEEPDIEAPTEKFIKEQNKQTNIKFNRYDKWTNCVFYNYQKVECLNIWLPEGTTDLPTFEEVTKHKDAYLVGYWLDDICRAQGIPKEDYKHYTSYNIKGNVSEKILETSTSYYSWSN